MPKKSILVISLLALMLVPAACGARRDARNIQTEPARPAATVSQPQTMVFDLPPLKTAVSTVAVAPQTFPEPQLASTSPNDAQQQIEERAVDIMRSGRILEASPVYADPDSGSEPVGEVGSGNEVIVTRALDEWYEIIFVDDTVQHAWLPQAVVTFEATPTAETEIIANTETQPTSTPTPATETATAAAPSPSPKPSQMQSGVIVFQTSSGGAIYTMNADGSDLRLLTNGGLDPALSPDGDQVAYTRWDDPRGLFVVDIDGSDEHRLVGDNFVKNPTWSPDGERIAFNLQSGGSEAQSFVIPGLGREINIPADPHWRLQVIDADGENREGLVDNMHSFNPAWSDYGILYAAEDGIYVTYADGVARPFFLSSNLIRNPSWSPDGRSVVAMMEFHDHWEIVRLNADGSGLVRLTKNYDRVNSTSPAWSPDGKSILYLSDQDGKWALWQMNADGSDQQPFAPETLADIDFRYDFNAERVVDWR